MAFKRSRSRGPNHDPGPGLPIIDAKRARSIPPLEPWGTQQENEDINQPTAKVEEMTADEEEMSVVKCRLSTFFCQTVDEEVLQQQQLIKDEIERSVCVLRQIQMEACHVANLHLLRSLERHRHFGYPLPVIDRNFFNRCISGVGIDHFNPSANEDTILMETIALYRQGREEQDEYQRPLIVNWDHSKSAMSKQMKTNARNMIVLQFYSRLARYVKLRHNISTASLVHILIREAFQEWGPRREVAMMIREWLEIAPTETNIEHDLAHFIVKLQDMLVFMENRYEAIPEDKDNRVFSLLPLSTSFVPAHIPINSSILHQMWQRIHQRLKKDKQVDLDPFKDFWVEKTDDQGNAMLDENGNVIMIMPTNTQFQFNRDNVWRKHFDISKFETARWRFAHYITTNGYDVSIVRKRGVFTDENPPALSERDFDPKIPHGYSASKVIGLDPGMRALCTVASERTREDDEQHPRIIHRFHKKKRVARMRTAKWKEKLAAKRRKKRLRRLKKRLTEGPITKREHIRQTKGERRRGNSLRDEYTIKQISTREYRHLAGFNKTRAWHEGIKKRYPDYGLRIRAVPSFKTASLTRYLERLRFIWKNINWLIEFCATQPFRKWRFHSHVFGSKALSHVAERIVPIPDPDVFVGYGDWSNRSGIKGHASGPVKGLKRELEKRATVRYIDEFRTSKRCYYCHEDNQDAVFPKIVNGARNGKITSRNVLHCKTSGCKMFWDRDVNASLNIMHVTTELLNWWPRPVYLQRGSSSF